MVCASWCRRWYWGRYLALLMGPLEHCEFPLGSVNPRPSRTTGMVRKQWTSPERANRGIDHIIEDRSTNKRANQGRRCFPNVFVFIWGPWNHNRLTHSSGKETSLYISVGLKSVSICMGYNIICVSIKTMYGLTFYKRPELLIILISFQAAPLDFFDQYNNVTN